MKNRISQGLNTDVEEADTLNLTPKITQKQIFESVISKLNKIRRGLYGPQGKKKFIMFLDNFGLPLRDQHGDQQAIELIHQLLDQKFMYEPATFNEVKLNNTTFITCMTSSMGSNTKISDRTLIFILNIST